MKNINKETLPIRQRLFAVIIKFSPAIPAEGYPLPISLDVGTGLRTVHCGTHCKLQRQLIVPTKTILPIEVKIVSDRPEAGPYRNL